MEVKDATTKNKREYLLDTDEPHMAKEFMAQLEGVSKIDYIVSQHAEQDHSGIIMQVLEKYPEAKLVCTQKAKGMVLYNDDSSNGLNIARDSAGTLF